VTPIYVSTTVNQSNSNPWIRKGFTSARYFRQTPDQKKSKD
jgi:hypothetical protein